MSVRARLRVHHRAAVRAPLELCRSRWRLLTVSMNPRLSARRARLPWRSAAPLHAPGAFSGASCCGCCQSHNGESVKSAGTLGVIVTRRNDRLDRLDCRWQPFPKGTASLSLHTKVTERGGVVRGLSLGLWGDLVWSMRGLSLGLGGYLVWSMRGLSWGLDAHAGNDSVCVWQWERGSSLRDVIAQYSVFLKRFQSFWEVSTHAHTPRYHIPSSSPATACTPPPRFQKPPHAI
jgi:hypothetical protein